MELEYVKLFAVGFGAVIGIPTIKFIWGVASDWRDMSNNVTASKQTGEETKGIVEQHAKDLQTIKHTLHGPLGDNGMYSDVRTMKDDIEELKEDRRTAAKPRRKLQRKGGRRFGDAA